MNLVIPNSSNFEFERSVLASLVGAAKKVRCGFTTNRFAPEINPTTSDCFEKSNTTINTLRKKCIEAAQKENAKEVAYIYDQTDDKIIDEYTGSNTSCRINTNSYKGEKLEIYHSHPNIKGIYLPVSFDDFEFLNNNENFNKIVAYGAKGQCTSLAKKKDYKKCNENKLNSLRQDFMQNLYSNAAPKEKEQIGKLIKYCKDYPNNSDSIKAKYISLIADLQKTENGASCIDSFWKQNAPELNLVYSSNM